MLELSDLWPVDRIVRSGTCWSNQRPFTVIRSKTYLVNCKCSLLFANVYFPIWPISTFQTLPSFIIRLSKRVCHYDRLSSSRHWLSILPDPRHATQRWQSVDPALIGQAVKENAPCVFPTITWLYSDHIKRTQTGGWVWGWIACLVLTLCADGGSLFGRRNFRVEGKELLRFAATLLCYEKYNR